MKTKLLLALFVILLRFAQAQQAGNALKFDGIDDHITLALPTVFNNISTNDFTMEAWIYVSNTAFSRIIFAQKDASNFASLSVSNSKIYFYVIHNGNTSSQLTTNTLNLNQWTHVAGRYIASTSALSIFLNGVLQSTGSGGGSSTGTLNDMTIGAKPGGLQPFAGVIDEIRIWDVARTDCEISCNITTTYTSTQNNLVAFYKFNQGTAGGSNTTVTTLNDSAGTNNGTLVNFALTGAASNWVQSSAGITTMGPQASVDNTVSLSWETLVSNETRAGITYQWLDCNNGYAIISNANSSTFAPTVSGNYAVRVSYNSCIDTSACTSVIVTGINSPMGVGGIMLFPNPVASELKISLREKLSSVIIEIRDITGRIVFGSAYTGVDVIPITFNEPPGIYFVYVTSEKENQVIKMIKQ